MTVLPKCQEFAALSESVLFGPQLKMGKTRILVILVKHGKHGNVRFVSFTGGLDEDKDSFVSFTENKHGFMTKNTVLSENTAILRGL